MRSTEKKHTISARARIFAVSVALLLVGGIAVYSASADDAPSDSVSTVPMLRSVPTGLAAEYGVFRRPTDASDSLVKQISIDSDYVTQLGLNPALARRITTPLGVPTEVWLAPTDQGACLFVQLPEAIAPGSVCGSDMTGDPYASADSYTSRDETTVDVVGMTRDAVKAVTVVLADGKKTDVPVADNVYVAHLTTAPRAVQLNDPDEGAVVVPISGYGEGDAPLR